jgi:hypothetical protein
VSRFLALLGLALVGCKEKEPPQVEPPAPTVAPNPELANWLVSAIEDIDAAKPTKVEPSDRETVYRFADRFGCHLALTVDHHKARAWQWELRGCDPGTLGKLKEFASETGSTRRWFVADGVLADRFVTTESGFNGVTIWWVSSKPFVCRRDFGKPVWSTLEQAKIPCGVDRIDD